MEKLKDGFRVIKHLRVHKKRNIKIDDDYVKKFAQALFTFEHQRVWSPQQREVVPLSNSLPQLEDAGLPYHFDLDAVIGAPMSAEEARAWVLPPWLPQQWSWRPAAPKARSLTHSYSHISAPVAESPRPTWCAAISNAPPKPSPARSSHSFEHSGPQPALASHNVQEKTPATHKSRARKTAKRKAAAITGLAGNKKRKSLALPYGQTLITSFFKSDAPTSPAAKSSQTQGCGNHRVSREQKA